MRTTRVGTHVAKLVMLVGAVGAMGGGCGRPEAGPTASRLGWRPGAPVGVAPTPAVGTGRDGGIEVPVLAAPEGTPPAESPAAAVAGDTGRAAELRLLAAFASDAGDAALADDWVEEAEAAGRYAVRPAPVLAGRQATRRPGVRPVARPSRGRAARMAAAPAAPVRSVATGTVVADSMPAAPEPAGAAPRKPGGVRGVLRRAARWLPGRRPKPSATSAPVRPHLPLPGDSAAPPSLRPRSQAP